MKKILFLILLCLLLTGCTINYNLEIEDNQFNETITGTVLNSEISHKDGQTDIGPYEYFLNTEQLPFTNNNNIYYEKTLNNTNDGVDYEYKYTFNENNFINSRILNTCFNNYTFESKDDKYYISLSGDFKCAYADKTKIKITTKYKVTAHNANKKSKNTYTWTINKDKIEDLNLFITIDKTKNASLNILNWSTLKTVGLIIILILSGITIFIAKKNLQK